MRPRVSIVLPTYNRADTIVRAVESVRAQTWEDWELVVVDDGSTDETRHLIGGIDPRVRLVLQDNRGVAAARNRGLAETTGGLIGFLDSDDAWTPHHLELAVAFFGAHPAAHLYSSEFWEDFGRGLVVKHFRPETSEWYPATAAEIGSTGFAAPAPLGDGYLRVYRSREEVGDWGREIVERTGHEGVFHYRGNVFESWRWGWLMALQPTVLTRHALEQVGPFDTSIPVASDFAWLALLCKRFEASFFSVPGTIKHELGTAGQELTEGHLATGKTAVQFHRDVLRLHEELFWKGREDDPELSALRGFRQFLVGQAAAKQGQRDVAMEFLREAGHTYHAWEARELRWLLEVARTPGMAKGAYELSVLPLKVRSRVSWLREEIAKLAGTKEATHP